MPQSCIEFYCGIGGFAAAIERFYSDRLQVAAAIDIDCGALEVYRANFPTHQAIAAEIASFPIERHPAELWWMSPPCLPFTRKGKQRDWDDPRAGSLISLINRLDRHSTYPRRVAIENVPPFAESKTGRWVESRLNACGFDTVWETRCPTEDKYPMRRSRCYLLASRDGLARATNDEAEEWTAGVEHQSIEAYIDRRNDGDPQWRVEPQWLVDYAAAIDRVEPTRPDAIASCFTSSYGRMPVRSGSYLQLEPSDPLAARYFTPEEILAMLGFPPSFRWPQSLSLKRRYAMAGNSVHVPTVARLIGRLIGDRCKTT
jgi:site-specific DNA-cytosine methylase